MGDFQFSSANRNTRLNCLLNVPRFDATVAPRFKEALRSAWKPTLRTVVLDFRHVNFIDSSGVGALLSVQKMLPADAEPVTLSHVGKPVAEVLELLRLHRVFNLSTG